MRTKTLERCHQQLERPYLMVLDELGDVLFSEAGAEPFFEEVMG